MLYLEYDILSDFNFSVQPIPIQPLTVHLYFYLVSVFSLLYVTLDTYEENEEEYKNKLNQEISLNYFTDTFLSIAYDIFKKKQSYELLFNDTESEPLNLEEQKNIDILEDLIKPNSFEVHNNLNLSGFVISTNTSQNGACDGNATLVFTGGVAPYTYLYSNGSLNNTATNLCQGYYSVSVTDALGETLSIPFVIASPNTIFSNSTYQDSTIVDSVYNAAVSNCVINYSAIDSVYISNYTNLSNNFISVTWNVVSGTTSETVTVIYSLDASSGVYTLVLQLFCPNKSLNQLLKAYDQIYIDNSFSGLEKIEDNIR
jgi:hypothetical protein